MSCCVCEEEASSRAGLTYHYMTHSVLQLAYALTELQTRLTRLGADCSIVTGEEKEEKNPSPAPPPPTSATKPDKAGQKGRIRSGLSSRCPHSCGVCGKVVSSRGALVKHMVRHRDKKPFQCGECSLQFNQNRDLKTHIMQKHTGQRPHVCGICQKVSELDRSPYVPPA